MVGDLIIGKCLYYTSIHPTPLEYTSIRLTKDLLSYFASDACYWVCIVQYTLLPVRVIYNLDYSDCNTPP